MTSKQPPGVFNKPLTRRQLITGTAIGLGLPAFLSAHGVGFEASNLKVEHIRLSIPGFPGMLRIIQLSDLHFAKSSRYLQRVLETANTLNPDHIYITGDLVSKGDYLQGCLQWLSNLNCDHIFFSPGNWEHWSGTLKNGLSDRLAETGIRTLNNIGLECEINQGAFYLAGIDDAYYGSPDARNALKGNSHNLPAIILSHSPLGVNWVRHAEPALVLSGHTHGGQVCIPGFGAIKTPPGSGNFERGFYSVGKTRLYVNRGIGTSIIPIRVFCPPELTLVDIS